MTKAEQAEREEARTTLRALLPPGSTIHTVLRSVSRSGMSRNIDAYILYNGNSRCISSLTAKATGISFNAQRGTLKIGGCGSDVGHDTVYELGHALYPDGFKCVGAGCPSNDHSNGDRDYTPHHHSEGGYALRHRWL